ncbi:MAG: DUF4070 domain-containing protein [Terrimicrobiaceae bacterium]|nr:DUF4070 domain-containing protein [Terrimicrobiaceae bacterium]
MKLLLVYPRGPDTFWSFKHVMHFLGKKAAFPPLGLLTVAAMLPPEWELRVVDLNVRKLSNCDLRWADYVMISAMIIHRESVREIAARCRAAGRTVIAGGPLFTTGSHEFPEIGHFVLGEAEHVMPELVRDLRRGALQAAYRSEERPDLSLAPIPRWDLIDLRHYVTMSVQFSRGCPFNCEFCDIIIMNGRVPRTKPASQLIAELDALRRRGWHDMVFIVDDNFIGNKRRTRELLREIIAWRKATGSRMGFLTEASVNLAEDAELCALMVEAGFKKVFLGLETPSAASLQECQKVQNTKRDLTESVQIIQRSGMEVLGGFIVGFDSDTPDIFRQQFQFVQRSGVVVAMVGLLSALPGTQLHQRLLKEGRMESGSSGNNTQAELNFTPRLDRDFLLSGYRRLMHSLYEPGNYYARVRTFLDSYRPRRPFPRLTASDVRAFLKCMWLVGVCRPGRRSFWRLFWGTLLTRPSVFARAMELSVMGYHFRKVAREL